MFISELLVVQRLENIMKRVKTEDSTGKVIVHQLYITGI